MTVIFETEGDGSQDDGTLYSLSGEFLEAARVLQATPTTRIDCSSATYYLLGHSAELLLKAYLFKCGLSIADLREFNHNLEKLVTRVKKEGLPSDVNLQHVLQLASTYQQKGFEYRTREKKQFPNLNLLTDEIEKLKSVVFSNICE